MSNARTVCRSILLTLTLLSACAAAEPTPGPQARKARFVPSGAFGAYLDGRFAMSQSDLDVAADSFLRALATDPGNMELVQQAFTAAVMGGRPEAVRLARQLPENQAALLLLADQEVKAGRWDAAEQRFRALPRQGLTQVLQPLLLAWAQQGGGRTEAALAILRPHVEGQRFKAVYTLHAALMADLAGRNQEAGRLYRTAQAEYGGINLRLAQILASWQTRQGHPAEAQQTMRLLTEGGDDMAIALPALSAAAGQRVVASASDGITEAYLALAAALRQQDAAEFSMLMLRLALDLRPDFTAARLLLADVMEGNKRIASALQVLAPVQPGDPLLAVVRVRRASLAERNGDTEEALRNLEQIARDYPDSPLPYSQQGDILRSKSRYAEAVAAYDKAIARVSVPSRSAWPLFYTRGIAYERSNQWTKAEADFIRALELAPDQPYVLNYLGYTWADQGVNLDRARKMIERAAELRPNDGSIVDSLGWVLLRQGDSDGAIRSLERAVELLPQDATINGHLGDAYWAVGRRREAQHQWRRALALNPEPGDAAKLEAKLNENVPPNGPAATAERRVQ